jgi:hypothetical protein
MIGRAAGLAALAVCAGVGCSTAAQVDAEPCRTREFMAELGPSQHEGYVCFAFEAGDDRRPISSASFELSSSSGVVLHHATLYTSSEARPQEGAFDCEPMPPDALAVHVAVPGSESLSLPADVALALRPDTRTFLVEAHLFRSSQAPVAPLKLSLCRAPSPPARLAGRFGVGASVPAIRPHQLESSTGRCRLSTDLHLMYSWPHMHRTGYQFHAALLRGERRIPVLDVERWDFTRQLTYSVEMDAEAGDVLESTCVWKNDSDAYVLPGIFTENEMCTHGVTGYPSDAAYCDPL